METIFAQDKQEFDSQREPNTFTTQMIEMSEDDEMETNILEEQAEKGRKQQAIELKSSQDVEVPYNEGADLKLDTDDLASYSDEDDACELNEDGDYSHIYGEFFKLNEDGIVRYDQDVQLSEDEEDGELVGYGEYYEEMSDDYGPSLIMWM